MSGDGFLGMSAGDESAGGRWQPLGADEEGTPRARASRVREEEGMREPMGPPSGVTASVQGDAILRTLLPLPLRMMIFVWPYLIGVVLVANVLMIFVLHQVWGQGHAYKMNIVDPANAAFCMREYDWYRNGDFMILIPLLALPEALRLRRFCLHTTDNTFSAPLADLYSSISLLTPESWQRTLLLNAGRCALAIGGTIAIYVSIMLPVMLSSHLMHYPARLARIEPYKDECGSDWWFGQVPDIFLLSFDLPVAALIFVPYFVVLHAAEGVRLALHAYAAEFEMRVSPANRDEGAMGETVRKHQALELLLEHAGIVLEPAMRWILIFGLGTVLAIVTCSWMEFSQHNEHHSVALFFIAFALSLGLLPILRAAEKINAYQARLEKLAFSVGDPTALGSALPATISHAAMLREYIREHSLYLPIGGVLIRPDHLMSSTSLISLFCLMSVPYFVLIMPMFFDDPHFNHFKRDMMNAQAELHDPYNGTKPLCVYCGHCAWHGWCPGGYYAQPGLGGSCYHPSWCRPVTYAAEILASGQAIIPY
mmetsp:Transcript_18844/g.48049  ORF Transcript_18844/g.48049 Transcript_18844/m.48049 type:complete len:538 (-) Transcript_18844:580-2193(-)